MRLVIWGLLLLLTVMHQSYRYFTGDRLLAGFLPEELAWQAVVSLGAAFTWFLATQFAWPADDELPSTAVSAGQQPAADEEPSR